MATSYDVEKDMVDKMATIASLSTHVITSGATRNAWSGPERAAQTSSDGQFPLSAVFVQAFSGSQEIHNDGRIVRSSFQVLTRFGRGDYTNAEVRARAIHDALDLIGAFTVNGNTYKDVRADGAGPMYMGPDDNDAECFVETFTAWWERAL